MSLKNKIKINPEIEEFYTKAGYSVDTDITLVPIGSPWRLYWCIEKDGKQISRTVRDMGIPNY
jgi:hypothetical protein